VLERDNEILVGKVEMLSKENEGLRKDIERLREIVEMRENNLDGCVCLNDVQM
jgi:hypothetical protein